jgi:hypothetical protein
MFDHSIFTKAGMSVDELNDGKLLKIYACGPDGGELILSYWPSSRKCMIFGKVFVASPDQIICAVEAGRFKPPAGSELRECKRCHRQVFWVITNDGKKMPVDETGDAHFGTCGL